MKPGTIIQLPDGREGTVVYHGLDGYGIQWGAVEVDVEQLLSVNGLFGTAPDDWPWFPEAMLRDPWPNAEIECVGSDYKVVQSPKGAAT